MEVTIRTQSKVSLTDEWEPCYWDHLDVLHVQKLMLMRVMTGTSSTSTKVCGILIIVSFSWIICVCVRFIDVSNCFRCRGWAGLAGGRYPPGGSKCIQIWYACVSVMGCVKEHKCVLMRVLSHFPHKGSGRGFFSVSVQNQNSGLLSWLQSYLHSTHWKPAISNHTVFMFYFSFANL